MARIYLEGDEKEIAAIIEIIRPKIGSGINVVDLNPRLLDEDGAYSEN